MTKRVKHAKFDISDVKFDIRNAKFGIKHVKFDVIPRQVWHQERQV
jgi:hypothetical protein